MMDELHGSQRQILRSTTLIGGSTFIQVVFRIIQAKAAAVLIGPAGVGLLGVFNAITGLAGTLAGMGLNSSGVRQIAEAAGSGDQDRIVRTIGAFRRVALFFGLAGGATLFALRSQVSQLTFGSAAYAGAVGLLAIVPVLMVLSGAQSALLRGMRRVGDQARANIAGVSLGTLLGLPILYIWRLDGIAPYVVTVAAMTVLATWWFARKITIRRVAMSWRQVLQETRGLLSLGVLFMSAGLGTMATTYLVKVLVTRQLGLDSAGLYEASSALSNVYVGFILSAMGADFYPHLAGVAHDPGRARNLINDQVRVGLLLATPGLLAMLALGPFILHVMYAAEFTPAFEIMRWQVLGTFLRVVSFPFGYLILAKGRGNLFLFTETSTNVVYLSLVMAGLRRWQLPGVGLAFLGMYTFYVLITLLAARKLVGFSWSQPNLRLISGLLPLVGLAAVISFSPDAWISGGVGLALGVLAGLYALRSLYAIVGPELLKRYLVRIKRALGARQP